jgi:hypothetical protein
VVAFLPANDPTASSALAAHCGAIDLVLADAFRLVSASGSVMLVSDQGEELGSSAAKGYFEVRPVLGIAPNLTAAEVEAFLASDAAMSRLGTTLGLVGTEGFSGGVCLDLSARTDLAPAAVAHALAALRGQGRSPCLVARGDASYWSDPAIVDAVDLAVVQGFRRPAHPAESPAPAGWFEASVAAVQSDIPKSKLVVALGTQGFAWQSGRLGATLLPYADTILQLAAHDGTFEFEPEAGAGRIRFLDSRRRLVEGWLLDAPPSKTSSPPSTRTRRSRSGRWAMRTPPSGASCPGGGGRWARSLST